MATFAVAGASVNGGAITVTIPSGSNHAALMAWWHEDAGGSAGNAPSVPGGASVLGTPVFSGTLGFRDFAAYAITGLTAGASRTFTPPASGGSQGCVLIVASDVDQTTPFRATADGVSGDDWSPAGSPSLNIPTDGDDDLGTLILYNPTAVLTDLAGASGSTLRASAGPADYGGYIYGLTAPREGATTDMEASYGGSNGSSGLAVAFVGAAGGGEEIDETTDDEGDVAEALSDAVVAVEAATDAGAGAEVLADAVVAPDATGDDGRGAEAYTDRVIAVEFLADAGALSEALTDESGASNEAPTDAGAVSEVYADQVIASEVLADSGAMAETLTPSGVVDRALSDTAEIAEDAGLEIEFEGGGDDAGAGAEEYTDRVVVAEFLADAGALSESLGEEVDADISEAVPDAGAGSEVYTDRAIVSEFVADSVAVAEFLSGASQGQFDEATPDAGAGAELYRDRVIAMEMMSDGATFADALLDQVVAEAIIADSAGWAETTVTTITALEVINESVRVFEALTTDQDPGASGLPSTAPAWVTVSIAPLP